MFPKVVRYSNNSCSLYKTIFNGIDLYLSLSSTNQNKIHLTFDYLGQSIKLQMLKTPDMLEPKKPQPNMQHTIQTDLYENHNFKNEFVLPEDVANILVIMMLQVNQYVTPEIPNYKPDILYTLYILENKESKYFDIAFLEDDEDEEEFINSNKYNIVFNDKCYNKQFILEKIIFNFNRITDITSTRSEITKNIIKFIDESKL